MAAMLCAVPVGECGLMPERVPRRALDDLVVIVRNSHEQRQVGAALQIQHNARILHRLPGRLQKQPMLRVHVRGFAWRNSEELRIELVDSHPKILRAVAMDLPATPGSEIVEPLQIPAVRRHLADSLAAFNEKFPK